MAFQKTKYHLLALVVAMIWGTTFISTKLLLISGLSPEDIFFFRFALAYVTICFVQKNPLFAKNWRDEMRFLLLGITGGSAYFLTENFALHITQASNVSLIVCTNPLLTLIFSHIFLQNEKLNRRVIQGSLLALLGMAMVVFNGQFLLQLNPVGDLLSFLAAFSWACYTILLKRISHRYPILLITRKVFFYGLLTILPLLVVRPFTTDPAILFQPIVYLNLLFLGIAASLLCYFFWNAAIKHLGAVKTTNYVYIIPMITLIAASLILDEKITVFAIIGMMMILAGLFWAEKRYR